MKAPDKIYLYKCKKQGIRTDGICTEWSEKPVILTEENIEYIRKNALMEWLNERFKSTISNVGCYTGHSVWAEVIEHINEM